jgi:membrane-associated phospholipid phosphatase
MRGFVARCVLAITVAVCAAAAPLSAQTVLDRPGVADAAALPIEPSVTEPALTPTIDFNQVVQQPTGPPATPRHTGIKAMLRGLVTDVKHLPSRENLIWAGVGGGLALAVHPADDNINQALRDSTTADRVFKAGEILGSLPTLLGTASVVYAVGRLQDKPKVSHVGMDLIRSLIISEGVTQTLKYTTRRERPDGSGRTSFPSGHAADTFAVATALERHLGWRYFVPAYVFASYVAISRLPANRHWFSDTVFGATVGIIAGRTVTSEEANPFPVAVTRVPGGIAVMYSHRSK